MLEIKYCRVPKRLEPEALVPVEIEKAPFDIMKAESRNAQTVYLIEAPEYVPNRAIDAGEGGLGWRVVPDGRVEAGTQVCKGRNESSRIGQEPSSRDKKRTVLGRL